MNFKNQIWQSDNKDSHVLAYIQSYNIFRRILGSWAMFQNLRRFSLQFVTNRSRPRILFRVLFLGNETSHSLSTCGASWIVHWSRLSPSSLPAHRFQIRTTRAFQTWLEIPNLKGSWNLNLEEKACRYLNVSDICSIRNQKNKNKTFILTINLSMTRKVYR